MRKSWSIFIILQLLIIVTVGAIVYSHNDRVQLIKQPPEALAQWYKPQNKRQVWLHNMFKLRREMQAVAYYAQLGDQQHVNQWLEQLDSNYRKIAEMVPSWEKKLDLEILATLAQSASLQHFDKMPSQLANLASNCQSCHDDFRAITATKYRAPDFSTITLANDLSYQDNMVKLSEQVNLIKIAATDGFGDIALSALGQLNQGIEQLGQTCVSCHKDNSKTLPTLAMKKTLNSLEQALTSGTLKEQGQQLGTLAVQVCATCHATHRLSFDNRMMLEQPRTVLELIKNH